MEEELEKLRNNNENINSITKKENEIKSQKEIKLKIEEKKKSINDLKEEYKKTKNETDVLEFLFPLLFFLLQIV